MEWTQTESKYTGGGLLDQVPALTTKANLIYIYKRVALVRMPECTWLAVLGNSVSSYVMGQIQYILYQ